MFISYGGTQFSRLTRLHHSYDPRVSYKHSSLNYSPQVINDQEVLLPYYPLLHLTETHDSSMLCQNLQQLPDRVCEVLPQHWLLGVEHLHRDLNASS